MSSARGSESAWPRPFGRIDCEPVTFQNKPARAALSSNIFSKNAAPATFDPWNSGRNRRPGVDAAPPAGGQHAFRHGGASDSSLEPSTSPARKEQVVGAAGNLGSNLTRLMFWSRRLSALHASRRASVSGSAGRRASGARRKTTRIGPLPSLERRFRSLNFGNCTQKLQAGHVAAFFSQVIYRSEKELLSVVA